MSVFVKTIIVLFCLCASPKLLDSLEVPVKIDELKEHEVAELLKLCDPFKELKMRNVTIYTVTDISQVVRIRNSYTLYQGTAELRDYIIPVGDRTLSELCNDKTLRHLYKEISLRIINVVESVGVFLLIKISMLAGHIAGLSPTPREGLRILLPTMDKIHSKFQQLSISLDPIKHLVEVITSLDNKVNINYSDRAIVENSCVRFMNTYLYLNGFVDIGDVDVTNIDPSTNTIEDFFILQLDFINTNVDKYFVHITLEGQ